LKEDDDEDDSVLTT